MAKERPVKSFDAEGCEKHGTEAISANALKSLIGLRIRLDPEYVLDRLNDHLRILRQDAAEIPLRRHQAEHNSRVRPQSGSINDLIRANLIIAQTAANSSPDRCTPSAWHPFILDFCRILGVEYDMIDRLFQRIIHRDLTDKRAIMVESDAAMSQLDRAIAIVRRQYKAGEPVIRFETQSKGSSDGSGQAEAASKPPKERKSEHRATSEELFKAALRTHHKYETGGSVLNFEPASIRKIEALTGNSISDSTALRLLGRHFGSVEKYRDACFTEAIGQKLVVLLGDGLHAFGAFDANESEIEDRADNDSDDCFK